MHTPPTQQNVCVCDKSRRLTFSMGNKVGQTLALSVGLLRLHYTCHICRKGESSLSVSLSLSLDLPAPSVRLVSHSSKNTHTQAH